MTRFLQTRITRLEMLAPPSQRVAMPFGPRLAMMRATEITPSFYRYLYEEVGRRHHWSMRRGMSDDRLRAELHSVDVEIEVLYCDGSPAGFYELDLKSKPDNVYIQYFGLLPDFQGRGLSRFFLSEAVFAAWAHAPEKLTINTNTLDNPRALLIYQRAGFVPVGYSDEQIAAWD